MASLTKQYDRQKLTGQVFTPAFVVDKILNDTGFDGPEALGRPVLDPACGDGRFLEAVVRRILDWSPKKHLAHHLAQVHGWDTDAEALAACRAHLDRLTEPAGLRIPWNLRHGDALAEPFKSTNQQINKSTDFDFIVGNPPYIRIQHLEAAQRRFIQEHYTFCRGGSTDIFIAFYELADRLLAPEGRCGFITPNTFFYTETARPLREHFAQNRTLVQVTNYGDIQLFDNATTYSAIAIFGKNRASRFVLKKPSGKTNFCGKTSLFPNSPAKNSGNSALQSPKHPPARASKTSPASTSASQLCATRLTFFPSRKRMTGTCGR